MPYIDIVLVPWVSWIPSRRTCKPFSTLMIILEQMAALLKGFHPPLSTSKASAPAAVEGIFIVDALGKWVDMNWRHWPSACGWFRRQQVEIVKPPTCSWLRNTSISSAFTPFRTTKQWLIAIVVSPTTNFSLPTTGRRRRSVVSTTAPNVVFSWGIIPRGIPNETASRTSTYSQLEGLGRHS